ncbi:VanZ family protein [Microbacterium sp. NPDC091313]
MLRPAAPRTRAVLVGVLCTYVLALALIAFWPTHVDRDAGPLLRAITRAIPWLTYGRMEFSANILLFVPFGLLLTLLVRRWPWVIALGVASSATIELVQEFFLPGRTGSILDVVANGSGTVIGVLVGLVWLASTGRLRLATRTRADRLSIGEESHGAGRA